MEYILYLRYIHLLLLHRNLLFNLYYSKIYYLLNSLNAYYTHFMVKEFMCVFIVLLPIVFTLILIPLKMLFTLVTTAELVFIIFIFDKFRIFSTL